MEREKKKTVVAELGEKLKRLNSMFLAEYKGMSVAQITRLRKELRGADVEFSVVKNSLLKIASEGTKAEALKDKFTGPNAIVCVYKDPISAAKIMAGFVKEAPMLKLKAGFLGTQILNSEEIIKLATLPSKEILIAKFMGLLQGTPQRLLYVLSGNVSKLMMTLNAIKMQKEQA
ncbi:MAG TPA: 50S ribosomal protein L10 [Syntrophorhabdaceae bacterium]|nr:50S ribosomal protein L10 [Syntrophorhabdaceae bacterium]HOF57132.1 50S ribosomal protein L10 [Syntrophorhabdaceae bacterium]HOS05136.1 50S ribosomal protein L10 [Syntrophorhabdaceae bacterium]HPL40378.1 50S ribosomal protein L10 [Syntrophorhabdaceae bacterium]